MITQAEALKLLKYWLTQRGLNPKYYSLPELKKGAAKVMAEEVAREPSILVEIAKAKELGVI